MSLSRSLHHDLLDVTRTSEELGKDAAHDAESGKVTWVNLLGDCLLYTSPSPRDRTRSRMPSSA